MIRIHLYSGWCQTALPHRRPADNAAVWRATDSMTLLVEPGLRVQPGRGHVHVGVPFGAIARLIPIYLQSEALRGACNPMGFLCQEDARASCCARDKGGPFGAVL